MVQYVANGNAITSYYIGKMLLIKYSSVNIIKLIFQQNKE